MNHFDEYAPLLTIIKKPIQRLASRKFSQVISQIVQNTQARIQSCSVPVRIIGLKFIQFASPVSSLSVIMVWDALSASTLVSRFIWYAITVHTPPGKKPITNKSTSKHKVAALETESYIMKHTPKWALVSFVFRWLKLNWDIHCSYLTHSVAGKCLWWDVWTSQHRIFHISISSWICQQK